MQVNHRGGVIFPEVGRNRLIRRKDLNGFILKKTIFEKRVRQNASRIVNRAAVVEKYPQSHDEEDDQSQNRIT
jgi:hypothetical protein